MDYSLVTQVQSKLEIFETLEVNNIHTIFQPLNKYLLRTYSVQANVLNVTENVKKCPPIASM